MGHDFSDAFLNKILGLILLTFGINGINVFFFGFQLKKTRTQSSPTTTQCVLNRTFSPCVYINARGKHCVDLQTFHTSHMNRAAWAAWEKSVVNVASCWFRNGAAMEG